MLREVTMLRLTTGIAATPLRHHRSPVWVSKQRRLRGDGFTADETRPFVNDTEAGHIRVFEATDEGSLSGGHVWADVTGDGDGAPSSFRSQSVA